MQKGSNQKETVTRHSFHAEFTSQIVEITWKVKPFMFPYRTTGEPFSADETHPIFKHVLITLSTGVTSGRHHLTVGTRLGFGGPVDIFIHNAKVDISGPQTISRCFAVAEASEDHKPVRAGAWTPSFVLLMSKTVNSMDWILFKVTFVLSRNTPVNSVDLSHIQMAAIESSVQDECLALNLLEMQQQGTHTDFCLVGNDGSKLKG